MAEFLIFAKEGKADPAEGFQKYDIIAVGEDGHAWGREECLDRFVVVRIPGMTTEAARKYTESIVEVSPGSDPEMPETKVRAVRKYQIKYEKYLRPKLWRRFITPNGMFQALLRWIFRRKQSDGSCD